MLIIRESGDIKKNPTVDSVVLNFTEFKRITEKGLNIIETKFVVYENGSSLSPPGQTMPDSIKSISQNGSGIIISHINTNTHTKYCGVCLFKPDMRIKLTKLSEEKIEEIKKFL